MRRPLLLLALLLPALAGAAERRHSITGFDRVRVNGPFEVSHAPGSAAALVGGDARAIERVEVRVDGSTLTIRMGNGAWGERREAGPTAPITVALTSPTLTGASVLGGGRMRVARVKGARLDLLAGGASEIAVADVQVDQLSAALTGAGSVTLAGRAGRARLATDGPGRIDAGALRADELTVLVNGTGETRAQARYAANIVNVGLGTITIAGRPKCTVKAPAGGVVRCGD